MKAVKALALIGFSALSVRAQAALYWQCGGIGWTGATSCVSGAVCTYQNDYYWQCLAMTGNGASTTPTTKDACATPTATSGAAIYGQCGGKGWTGPTTCINGAVCTYQNDYYSQCLLPTTRVTGTSTTPATSSHSTATTSLRSTPTTSFPSSLTTSTNSPTTAAPTGTSTTQTSPCTSTPPASAGKLHFAGVNIAGFDFGMGTDGEGVASAAYPPLSAYSGTDGSGQMTHFVNDDKFNIFRLPVAWQFLTDNVASGPLSKEYFAEYHTLVQSCIATGASCIIDIHNYARWNGEIIGQGGPSNDAFASLWSSLAGHYASEHKVIFGIMNEPHDLPNLESWVETVQAAVTAIRKAGATTQMILLPGDHYTSAETFVSGGSAAALAKVKNPDGSHTNLVFDVHRYLDSDNSGSADTCTGNSIAEAWEPLSRWLRCNGRQVLITETGGGNTASCEQYMCEQIKYLAENSDVILGYVGWAAGSFSATYTLSETPTKNGDAWSDQSLVTTCMAPVVNGYLA